MPYVGLVFELTRAETVPGQEICVVGSLSELGHWDPDGAIHDEKIVASSQRQLHTSALCYPRWSMLSPVWIELMTQEPEAEDDPHGGTKSASASMPSPSVWHGIETLEIEYKYIKHTQATSPHGRPSYEWESNISNRYLRVPKAPGTIWFVSDAAWDSSEGATITQSVDWPLQLHTEHVASIEQLDFLDCSLTETTSVCSRAYDIEDQFEVLSEMNALAMPKAADDFTTEALDLSQENAMLRHELDSKTAQIRLLQNEIERVKAEAVQTSQSFPDSLRGS